MEDVKIREFLALSSGDGDGSGSGHGDDCGHGSGYDDGSGYGIAEINGNKIYMVDCVPTIFKVINGNVAKGYIVQGDLNLKPCYIVKGNNQFAHGSTLHEAMDALREKMFEDMPEEERIAEFIKAHPDMDKAYDNKDLFEWHHHLTGSCLMGREQFVQDRGLSLDGETTVCEFIELTKNSYGGDVIKRLEEAYETD